MLCHELRSKRIDHVVYGKNTLFKLTIFALVLAVLAMGVLVQYRAEHLAEQQAALIEENFLASKRAALKNYVELALSSIESLYGSGRDDTATQDQAKAILQTVNYGDDGYFFVYDLAGNNLVHPRKPEFVGRNLWDMTDPRGRHFFQDFVKAATHGDGFQVYVWERPSTRKMTEQLGYVVMLERWGWIVGTGIYLDDVETATRAVKKRAAANLQELVGIALGVVLAVFISGLALSVREHRSAEREQKAMDYKVMNDQEAERIRVGLELHHGIKSSLGGVMRVFEAALVHAERNNSPDAITKLRDGLQMLIAVMGDVRRIAHDMVPKILVDLPLSSALEQTVREFGEHSGIAVETVIATPDHRVPDAVAKAVFLLTKEALSNIAGHAGATQVYVNLDFNGRPAALRLEIIDNGKGFDVDALMRLPREGIGLTNMRLQIEMMKGKFSVASGPSGTTISVSIPVAALEGA